MDPKSSLWASGRDEEVQVNQRALIDKVLARYSGEHTVLRELLQNSDDAGAKKVEIHFNTKSHLDRKSSADTSPQDANPGTSVTPKLPDLTKELLHQWEFRNDGIPFREEDWNRLKKIAEGNPDEEKIGAFGVGFYSLFSVTDEPFVTSGGQWMGFYWKDNKDQLFARRGTLPPTDPTTSSSWTSFTMPLREPSTLPARPVDIARFLATSSTFMRNLQQVSVFFNEHRLVKIKKSSGPAKNLPLLSNLDPKTKISGTMTVKEIQSLDLRIQAKVLRWVYTTGSEKPLPKPQIINAPKPSSGGGGFFSTLFSSFVSPSPLTPQPTPPPTLPPPPPVDPLEPIDSSVLLTLYNAKVETKLSQKMLTELERATKKKPPSICWYSLIYTGKDEYDISKEEDDKHFKATGSVFQGLRADLDGAGTARVFIGHATSQSTGIGGHISARFIPTVERESIDLVDRQVSTWNKELLWVGGYLSRFIYESQLGSIRSLWDESVKSAAAPGEGVAAETKQWLEGKALHAMKFFTFHPTTPSATVGLNMEAAFFACSKDRVEFSLISTAGVRPASQIRTFSPDFRSFMKGIPMIPEAVDKGAPMMMQALRERGVVRDITFKDVIEELNRRPLTEQEMVDCLNWRMNLNTEEVKTHDDIVRTQFLDAAVLTIGEGESGRIVPLSTIKTFLSSNNNIPPNCPLPPHTLPFSLSKHFKPDQLKQFFGWADLSIPNWLQYLISPGAISTLPPDSNILTSLAFAEKVLGIVAKSWGGLSKPQMTFIVELLQNKTIMPTRSGMKTPKEAYFANANVFPDLPIVVIPVKGNMEKVLIALGVMKHVDLQIVFSRMVGTGDWGIQDLAKYLVAVRGSLTSVELERLKHTAAFRQEASAAKPDAPVVRKTLTELYEPTDQFRELGLPLLEWSGAHKWRSNSDEAKLLFELGLRRFPPLLVVLELAAGRDLDVRRKALQYFFDNFSTRYATTYNPNDVAHLAFVPAIKADGTAFLAKPSEVFIDSECAFLGFSLVEPSLRNDALVKLKIPRDPPTSLLLPILTTRAPKEPELARRYFEYLAGRIADFPPDQFAMLRNLPIIPAKPPLTDTKGWVMCKPSECFFRSERSASAESVHSKLFTFVDFGSKANNFLRACGVKHEPNVQEIAELIVKDPKRFLDLAGGPRGYLDELRQIAAHQAFPPQLILQFKRTPFLLGSKRVPKPVKSKVLVTTGDQEEDEYEVTFDLLRPDQIVIVDDTNAYSLFCENLFSAPQEDLFEYFYMSLGSKRLSSIVTEEYKPQQIEGSESPQARDLRNLVLQRFPLFLHERGAQCKVKAEWLNSETNFLVRGCGRLSLVRRMDFGGHHVTKTQEASAAATLRQSYTGLGPLTLYISKSDKLDMYEVAHSICKLLLKNPKVNDSLLFMTILSTDLRALRRRGFNVDRILHQQQAERELMMARQAAAEREERQRLPMPPGADPFQQSEKAPSLPPRPALPPLSSQDPSRASTPGADTSSLASTLVGKPEPELPAPAPPAKTGNRSSTAQMLNSFKNKFNTRGGASQGGGSSAGPSASGPSTQTPSRNEQAQVTPTKDIERNIQTAIDACRSENSSVLSNRQQMTKVKESLEDGYCDISGTEKDFDLIATVSGYKFYVARDVAAPQQTARDKQPVLSRFVNAIINPLKEVYKLTPSSLHIFYDQKGDLIAFNRNGGLFLNLRYYESWHDVDVQNGRSEKGLISWYHSLAHEIAHNLVHPHNSEHEFYFSAICESHLLDFTKVLNRAMAS